MCIKNKFMTQDMCLDISKSKDCIRNKTKIEKKNSNREENYLNNKLKYPNQERNKQKR